METVGTRIEQILQRMGISARELARRADLGETQVSVLINRFRKNPNTQVTVETLRAIAKGASVSEHWLITGRGDPSRVEETHAPSFTDDATPVMANVPGYLEVEARDRARHPEVEEQWWLRGRTAAALMITGPAQDGDAYELARLAKMLGSEERLAQALRERERRIAELEGEVERLRRAEAEALAKKAARRAGKAAKQ